MEPVIPKPAQVEMYIPVESQEELQALLLDLWSEWSGGILSATGSLVALPFRIGVFTVTLSFRIGMSVGDFSQDEWG